MSRVLKTLSTTPASCYDDGPDVSDEQRETTSLSPYGDGGMEKRSPSPFDLKYSNFEMVTWHVDEQLGSD